MRVLLIGATGFLGTAIHAALVGRGDAVLATYHRGRPRNPIARTRWHRCDLARANQDYWAELLTGADAVINCAGVLQDSLWESTSGVHVAGVKALVVAGEKAHIFRFIHFSAIGAEREVSAFSRSKQEGEQVIARSLLDWVILRPSVVVGAGAFGGSALFRGLAALPILPVMPNTGQLQIVQRDDVVATVLHFLSPNSRPRHALDLVGPEQLSMTEVVQSYRRWLGWGPARPVPLTEMLAQPIYRLGDAARALGWRPPLGGTARLEMRHGATGDPEPWQSETGIVPARLAEALARTPASVQERWFAKLYLLKPVGFVVFALFWIATGVISLTSGYATGIALMEKAGAGGISGLFVWLGALADIGIGLAVAFRHTARLGLMAALALTGLYLVAGTLTEPGLWADPLGPLPKIFPIVVLNLMLLALLEER